MRSSSFWRLEALPQVFAAGEHSLPFQSLYVTLSVKVKLHYVHLYMDMLLFFHLLNLLQCSLLQMSKQAVHLCMCHCFWLFLVADCVLLQADLQPAKMLSLLEICTCPPVICMF